MRNFIKKLYICLFEPRKMGLFFSEKLWKSFLQILLISFIAILPFTVSLVVRNEISNSSYHELEEWVMEDSVDLTLKLSEGILDGEKNYAILIDEAIIFINPTGEVLNVGNEYAGYHVVEFGKEGIEVSLLNNVTYEKTYLELGVKELDFFKMEETDYIEFDRFISLINDAFNSIKVEWIIVNVIYVLIEVFLFSVISALFLALIVKIFNPLIGFSFRFKAALDGQFISLLFTLFMLLFKSEFLRYVGIVFSAIYVIKAMITIVRIEYKNKIFADKEGEDK